MAKTSGGVRASTSLRSSKRTPIDVQSVKRGLVDYAREDRLNRNSEYSLGMNAQAQGVIDQVADGNYGFASQVAQTVRKYNYRISEKQAYVIAKSAVDNEVTGLRRYDGEPQTIFVNFINKRRK